MSGLPRPPAGITRDDTQHGRVYYTLAQMRDYGQACADAERARLESDEYTTPEGGYSKAFHDLFSTFGMKE